MMTEHELLDSIRTKADAATQQATLKIIERARQTNTPIVLWDDGKVKEISVDEFEASLQKQRLPRQFGMGKGKLKIVNEDDQHLEHFEDSD